ncbi:MAG: PIN domain-containing protein [Pirellulales bacterium]
MTPSPVYVDSSAWIAWLHKDDDFHGRAKEELLRLEQLRCELVTTDWVIAESGNGLARTGARPLLMAAVARFESTSRCRLIDVDSVLLKRALQLYNQVSDKYWGLVDCAGFVLMRDMEMIDVLTTDQHFEQAGFRRLLVKP